MTVKHSSRVLLVVALMLTALLALTGGAMAMDATSAPSVIAPSAALEIAVSQDVTETAVATEVVPTGPMDIVDTAINAGSFKTLVSALTEKGLVEALKGVGPFTVFAPTDAAFQALPLADRIKLYRGADTLEQTLLNHVVAGEVLAADITDGMTLETLQGTELVFSIEDGTVYVNGAPISSPDIETTNGVIHAIDAVLTLTGGVTAAPAAVAETEAVTATEVVTDSAAVSTTEVVTAAEAMTETMAMTETAAIDRKSVV